MGAPTFQHGEVPRTRSRTNMVGTVIIVADENSMRARESMNISGGARRFGVRRIRRGVLRKHTPKSARSDALHHAFDIAREAAHQRLLVCARLGLCRAAAARPGGMHMAEGFAENLTLHAERSSDQHNRAAMIRRHRLMPASKTKPRFPTSSTSTFITCAKNSARTSSSRAAATAAASNEIPALHPLASANLVRPAPARCARRIRRAGVYLPATSAK